MQTANIAVANRQESIRRPQRRKIQGIERGSASMSRQERTYADWETFKKRQQEQSDSTRRNGATARLRQFVYTTFAMQHGCACVIILRSRPRFVDRANRIGVSLLNRNQLPDHRYDFVRSTALAHCDISAARRSAPMAGSKRRSQAHCAAISCSLSQKPTASPAR